MTKAQATELQSEMAELRKMLESAFAERKQRTQKRTAPKAQPKVTKKAQKLTAKVEKRDAVKQQRQAIYAQHPDLHPSKRPLIGYTHEQLVAAGTRNAEREIKARAQMRALLGKRPIDFAAAAAKKQAA